MTQRHRLVIGTLGALLVVVVASGFQIQDYPVFNKPPGSPAKGAIKPRKYTAEMTDEEVRKYMKEMAAEIGAKCDLCHNTKDYSSFEKQTKQFAQYKMGMVEWLNAKYRPPNATWEYSCYTCHRGKMTNIPSVAPPAAPGKS